MSSARARRSSAVLAAVLLGGCTARVTLGVLPSAPDDAGALDAFVADTAVAAPDAADLLDVGSFDVEPLDTGSFEWPLDASYDAPSDVGREAE